MHRKSLPLGVQLNVTRHTKTEYQSNVHRALDIALSTVDLFQKMTKSGNDNSLNTSKLNSTLCTYERDFRTKYTRHLELPLKCLLRVLIMIYKL